MRWISVTVNYVALSTNDLTIGNYGCELASAVSSWKKVALREHNGRSWYAEDV